LVRLTPGQQRQAWEIATTKATDPSKRQVDSAVYLVWRERVSKPNIEITSKPQESLSEEVKQDRLWQEVRKEMNELKEVATRWFEELPGLEAREAGMQRLQRWIDAFRKEFSSKGRADPLHQRATPVLMHDTEAAE
jgi:hypothetical protein